MLSQDLNPWIIGGGAVILSDVFVRHANITSPDTGKIVASDYGQTVQSSPYYGANAQ